MEKEESKKEWKKAIKKALEFYENNDWDNDSTIYHVLYEGKRFPPKEIYRKAEEFFILENPNGHLPKPGGGKPTNKLIEKYGFTVVGRESSLSTPKICKMQMKSDADKKNYVDEVLADNRITGDIKYVGANFELLSNGDIILIHKGNRPHSLVKVINRIEDATKITGISFGVDYNVEILSDYSELPDELKIKVGPHGSFHILKDKQSPTYQFIINWLNFLNPNQSMEKYIQLLKHKKQIILQGPPGTGKTYTAKKIAEQLTGRILPKNSTTLTPSLIKSKLSVGQRLDSPGGKPNYYTVNSINDDNVELQSDKSQPWKPKYTNIIAKYDELKKGNEIKSINNLDPYELAIAFYMLNILKESRTLSKENYTIVQFHPSYTYEDFVRGITVKNEKDKIVYRTENKIFGKLTKEATNANFKEKIPLWMAFRNHLYNHTIHSNEPLYFNSKKTIRLKEVYYPELENAKLKFEVPFQDNSGNWTAKEWIDIKSSFNEETLKNIFKDDFPEPIFKYFKDFAKSYSPNAIKENFVLIIDEINRANLPSVLGELIYALEYRGKPVSSMYTIDGDATITIPENLYIIGTMNTADRSVGHIDYAIKRRFAFVDMLPNADVIVNQKARELFNLVSELFTEAYLASDFEAKDVHLGHSYFLLDEESDLNESKQLQLKLDFEILPILNEYVKDGLLLETAKEKINQIATFEC